MPNCFIYCRVSTEEQAEKGFSLDAQEKLCRDFAEKNGYSVAGVYRDEGKSGTKLDRPALTELLSRCNKDSSPAAVIVQETDRLARNTKDHLTIKAILRKAGAQLISVAQPMLDDSPEGKMIDTILASVNQFQSDINGRKTKRGMIERFEQGWWPGWAPLGYMNITLEEDTGSEKSRKVVVKDPKRWDLLREGFGFYLTGNYAADEVNDVLYEKGFRAKSGKKLAHSMIVRTLRNPFYAGLMRFDGAERPGRHEPMITMSEHRRVLEIMDGHNLHACRRRKHQFLLRGFVVCGICGHRYTAEVRPAKKKAYYHCASIRAHSNRRQNVAVSSLEQLVGEQFKGIQFSESFIGLITSKLEDTYLGQREEISSRRQVLDNQKKAVEAKRDRAQEKLLSGVLSDDDYVRLKAKLAEELGAIQRQTDELDELKEIDVEVIREVLKLSSNIFKTYKEAPYDLKRQYLNLFWDRFVVRDGRITQAIPTELFSGLQCETKVRIMTNWCPSPPLIRTLLDAEYMKKLKEHLDDLLESLAKQTASERKGGLADASLPLQSL